MKLAKFGRVQRTRDILIGQVCGGEALIGSDSDDDKNEDKRGWSRDNEMPSLGRDAERNGISAAGTIVGNK